MQDEQNEETLNLIAENAAKERQLLVSETEKTIKVKIEVDTIPPQNFATEQKILYQPKNFMTR